MAPCPEGHGAGVDPDSEPIDPFAKCPCKRITDNDDEACPHEAIDDAVDFPRAPFGAPGPPVDCVETFLYFAKAVQEPLISLVCLLLHFDVLNPALQLIEPFLIVHSRPPCRLLKLPRLSKSVAGRSGGLPRH